MSTTDKDLKFFTDAIKDAIMHEIFAKLPAIVKEAQDKIYKEARASVDKIALKVADSYDVQSMDGKIIISVKKEKA